MNPLMILYIGAIFVAFYFLLIRPQQKRSKEQAELLSSLKVGDRVVTVGGIFGTIEHLDDEVVELRISDGVVVDLARPAISRKVDSVGHVLDETPTAAEADEDDLPAKPASGDVEEPEVHVGTAGEDAPDSEKAGTEASDASDTQAEKGQ